MHVFFRTVVFVPILLVSIRKGRYPVYMDSYEVFSGPAGEAQDL